METFMKMQNKWMALPLLLSIGYLAVNPPPMYAIFGFGDIVFDPSSWASLGHIWDQDISNGAKLVETYNSVDESYIIRKTERREFRSGGWHG
jgi:hypothetical protein